MKLELKIQFYYLLNNQLIAPNGTQDAKEVTLLQLCYTPKTTVLNHGKVIHMFQEQPKKPDNANSMLQKLYSKMDQYGT